MQLIVFGPPGAGKGTQAELLSSYLSIFHLSTGEILRSKLNEKDELSLRLQNIMSSGNLVSDDILNQIISEKLLSKECSPGFILDGYPRTINQMNYLNNYNQKNNIVINLIINIHVDNITIQNRILNRSKTENRDDDSIKTIETRVNTYNSETKPITEYYKNNHDSIYHEIDGSNKVEEIQKKLRNIVKNTNFS